MFCVACMMCAHDVGVNIAIAFFSGLRRENEKPQTCTGVGVVTRFDFSIMACICLV